MLSTRNVRLRVFGWSQQRHAEWRRVAAKIEPGYIFLPDDLVFFGKLRRRTSLI